MSQIFYDRVIGPTLASSGGDVTTTALTVTAESAPTAVTASTYANFVVCIQSPGTGPVTPSTATDTQGSAYTLLKEVQFAGFELDVFSRLATTPNVSTTITVSHQPSQHRIIVSDEWYNLGTPENNVSALSATVNADVDLGEFRVGRKHWLVYAVLAIGGSAYNDSVTIPDNWDLLHDTGSNYGDGNDVRLIIAYQIANQRVKVDFRPVISNPRVWGGVMFSYKQKI